MKKKIKIFILLIGILFVSTACEGYEEKKDVIPTDVTIYKLSRDVCDKFLNEPTYEILKGNNIFIINHHETFCKSFERFD